MRYTDVKIFLLPKGFATNIASAKKGMGISLKRELLIGDLVKSILFIKHGATSECFIIPRGRCVKNGSKIFGYSQMKLVSIMELKNIFFPQKMIQNLWDQIIGIGGKELAIKLQNKKKDLEPLQKHIGKQIPKEELTKLCVDTMESPLMITKKFMNLKMDYVPFVIAKNALSTIKLEKSGGLLLTTVIKPIKYVDYYAQIAIEQLVCLMTTFPFSNRPLNILRNIKLKEVMI